MSEFFWVKQWNRIQCALFTSLISKTPLSFAISLSSKPFTACLLVKGSVQWIMSSKVAISSNYGSICHETTNTTPVSFNTLSAARLSHFMWDDIINKRTIQKLSHTVFSSFATFGLAFTNIGILSNLSASFQTGILSGGPVTMICSWNVVAFFMLCIALSLAEICSAYPLNGIYYWAYELVKAGGDKSSKRAPFA